MIKPGIIILEYNLTEGEFQELGSPKDPVSIAVKLDLPAKLLKLGIYDLGVHRFSQPIMGKDLSITVKYFNKGK